MIDIKFRLNIFNPWHLLATGFGVGLSPIIPGTFGSIVAIPFCLLTYRLLPIWLCWFIVLFCFFLVFLSANGHLMIYKFMTIAVLFGMNLLVCG